MKFIGGTLSFWVALAMPILSTSINGQKPRNVEQQEKSVRIRALAGCRENEDPVYTDDKGNDMYERTLVSRDVLESDEEHQFEGTIMKIVMSLCPGESQISERIDSGLGDYYRISPTNETIANYVRDEKLQFADSGYPTYSRAYSPVTVLNNGFVEFMIKVERPGVTLPPQPCPFMDGKKDSDCKYYTADAEGNPKSTGTTGLTYMLLTSKIGTTFLMTNKPEHGYWGVDRTGYPRNEGYYAHELNIVDDPNSKDFDGPYTLNFIGGGIALTELNVVALSELLSKYVKAGTIERVNYLWSNSYYNLMSWVYNPSVGGDLATTFSRRLGSYGVQANVGLVFSREDRPESAFPKGRFTQTTIEEFFGVSKTECGKQSKKIKWLVVGSSGFKKSTYGKLNCEIGGLGFDLVNATDDQYGINKEGDNALYTYLARDANPADRKPSPVYTKYCSGNGLCENLN